MFKKQIILTLIFSVFIITQLISKVRHNNKNNLFSQNTVAIPTPIPNDQCKNFNNELLKNARRRVSKGQSVDYYYKTAWKYVNNVGEGSYDAIANFEYALSTNPIGAIYSDLGNCYRGGFKCFDKALNCYNSAIYNGFKKHFVYYNRAICKYEIGDLTGARTDYLKAKSMGWDDDYYKLNKKTSIK